MHFYYTNALTPQPQHYVWPKPSNFQKFIDILHAKSYERSRRINAIMLYGSILFMWCHHVCHLNSQGL